MLALALLLIQSAIVSAGEYAPEWPPKGYEETYPPEIEQAVGYATVYNPWRADELCREVLRTAKTPAVRARAEWARALAWGRFCVEYRTDRYLADYKGARKASLALEPGLEADRLAKLEIDLAFYVLADTDMEGVFEEIKARLAESSDDALALFQLGIAHWIAGRELKGEETQDLQASRLTKAATLVERAWALEPDRFEIAAYAVTLLHDADGLTSESSKAMQAAIEGWRVDKPYYAENDPILLAASIREIAAGESSSQLVKEAIARGERRPRVLFSAAQQSANEFMKKDPSATVSVCARGGAAEYSRFINDAEEGRIPLRGYDLRCLATAYYKLAAYQSMQGSHWEALATYRKLGELAPHYVQLHFNRGVLYTNLAREAEKANDPEEAQRLRDLADGEFAKQLEFDWQGRSAPMVEKARARLKR